MLQFKRFVRLNWRKKWESFWCKRFDKFHVWPLNTKLIRGFPDAFINDHSTPGYVVWRKTLMFSHWIQTTLPIGTGKSLAFISFDLIRADVRTLLMRVLAGFSRMRLSREKPMMRQDPMNKASPTTSNLPDSIEEMLCCTVKLLLVLLFGKILMFWALIVSR